MEARIVGRRRAGRAAMGLAVLATASALHLELVSQLGSVGTPKGALPRPTTWRMRPVAAADPAKADRPAPAAAPIEPETARPVPARASAAKPAGALPERPPPQGEVDVPRYATRLPPAFVASGTFEHHGQREAAVLRWQPDIDRYEARLESASLDWRSLGTVDALGLSPVRFVERRGRRTQAANFDADAGLITWSGEGADAARPPGSLDRLSWAVQMAGIVAAEPGRWTPGTAIVLFVAGAHGDAAAWRFVVQGVERPPDLPGLPVALLKLSRAPVWRHDLEVEVWLDPARQHRPVRLRWRNDQVDYRLDLATDDPLP